jgi:cell wall-associated NlpC family hydrolase
MNPDAQQVIDTCKNDWGAHSDDCSGFVKAVCADLGVDMSPGLADDIVEFFRDPANNWEQITDVIDAGGNVTTRKEEVAKERADAGELVLCGLTSAELGEAHGHVAVIVSGPLVHSNLNDNDYPVAYWGKLGGVGGQDQCLSFSFGPGSLNRVTYAAIAF